MEKLIKTSKLCERLSMGKDTAIAFMASLGVFPIPLGVGRGRGNYWLESAVDSALQQIAEQSKPKPKQNKPKLPKPPTLSLFSMPARDAFSFLTNHGPVQ